MAENPFTKLVNNSPAKKSDSQQNFQEMKINSLVEHVLEITVNKEHNNKNNPLVYMEDAAGSSSFWTIELLENSLFERLLMT
jgi:hypothetical protein